MRAARLAALLALAALAPECATQKAPQADAHQVADRSELVGGQRALGDVGDYLLQNDRIRVVIQGPGYSRGFGVYGGSLIDADLRRPSEIGSSAGGVGHDQFGEMFPAFFVQAVAADTVRVDADGKDGGAARIAVEGYAGDFLELLGVFNRAITGSNGAFLDPKSPPRIRYTTYYELSPGDGWVTVRFRVENVSSAPLEFPSADAKGLLTTLIKTPLDGLTVPTGTVALFGGTCDVFMPGVGFDLRFGLAEAYSHNIDLPAFPGLVTDWVASRAPGVSYGLVAAESDRNFVYNKKSTYETPGTAVTRSSFLVPFVASSFLGIFDQEAPPTLAPGDGFETRKYFVVGTGDVGSVLDRIHELRGDTTGTFSARVLDARDAAPATDARVIVAQRRDDGTRRPWAEYDVRDDGSVNGTLEPGNYSVRVTGAARPRTDWVDFTVQAGQATPIDLTASSFARVSVRVHDAEGRVLPAKASVVGHVSPADAGKSTRSFLFDSSAGEPWRSADLVPDDPNDPSTLRYIETTGVTDAQSGIVELRVRPGVYDVWVSRGPEYDVAAAHVTATPGESATVDAVLRRVVDTKGWIAADPHLHSVASIDSGMSLDDRVKWVAAEGVEWAVSTDHNYVTDLSPVVARTALTPWVKSSVGLEVTTLESGHFNGFPLRYRVGPVTHGALEWVDKPPGDLFARVRDLGFPGTTVVQVNHPRDSILGYFGQYNRDPYTEDYVKPPFPQGTFASPQGPAFLDDLGQTTFSDAFDLMEVVNGRLYWEIHHFRVPDALPPGAPPGIKIPAPGTLLDDEKGRLGFPGVVDDWYNLLNTGKRVIGVGVSDSHSSDDEAGYFRTMIHVGADDPTGLTDERVIAGLRSGRAFATNGPMLDLWVDDPTSGPMGSTVRAAGDTMNVGVSLTAAPWVRVDHLNVVVNGEIAARLPIGHERDLTAEPFSTNVPLPVAKDSWVVVEAIGNQSYFPMAKTAELPPLLLTDAVASLAGPLGIGGDSFGSVRPARVFPSVAYAITNPVWIKTTDGDWQAPGLAPRNRLRSPANDPGFLVTATGLQSADAPAAPTTTSLRRAVGATPNPFAVGAATRFDVRSVFSHVDDRH